MGEGHESGAFVLSYIEEVRNVTKRDHEHVTLADRAPVISYIAEIVSDYDVGINR